MTARTLPEWHGSKPDSAIPDRVRLRIFDAYEGKCAECTRKLQAGRWQLDHIAALINGGKHCESNLQPLCTTCHAGKTKTDIAEKARTYRKRLKATGIKTKKPWHPTLRKKMNGEVVPR
jgi:5-methylcytosine-specific restriction enzyme A